MRTCKSGPRLSRTDRPTVVPKRPSRLTLTRKSTSLRPVDEDEHLRICKRGKWWGNGLSLVTQQSTLTTYPITHKKWYSLNGACAQHTPDDERPCSTSFNLKLTCSMPPDISLKSCHTLVKDRATLPWQRHLPVRDESLRAVSMRMAVSVFSMLWSWLTTPSKLLADAIVPQPASLKGLPAWPCPRESKECPNVYCFFLFLFLKSDRK